MVTMRGAERRTTRGYITDRKDKSDRSERIRHRRAEPVEVWPRGAPHYHGDTER